MITYQLNGEKVTKAEFDERTARRAKLHGGVSGMCDSNTAPGGHACYWKQGHESYSMAVLPHQSAEYQRWIEHKGLTGVRVNGDGTVTTSSPGNKLKLANALEMVEQTPYGTGKTKTESTQAPPQPAPIDTEAIAAEARRIRQTPEIRYMLGEG